MSIDAVRHFLPHLPDGKVGRIDLFLHTDGGDSIVPWRLMSLLREYAEELHVLVPHRAFSAGTLTALGADRIVMHPLGMLGPIDPTVHDPFGPRDEESGDRPGVSVEDVAAYNDLVKSDIGITEPAEMIQAFKILAENVHPLTLGHVKRGTQQSSMLGRKLLELRNETLDPAKIDEILQDLTRKLYFHGHPIHRGEAEELGLHVEPASPSVEKAMWNLYLAYEDDLNMDQPFDPVAEALQNGGTIPKTAGVGTPVKLARIVRVVVETAAQADEFFNDIEISLGRNSEGAVTANVLLLDLGWSVST